MNSSDVVAALVDRARRLDPEAWEDLYRRAYPGLLAYAARRLGVERGRDAVAETMARAVAGIDRFEWRGGGFDAWLYGILRHVVTDEQRRSVREAGRRRLATITGADPLDHVLQGETAQATRRAFRLLPEADRELLELRVVAGLTVEEVSKLLGKRPGAVRMAHSRALARLRQAVEREGA